MYRIIPYVILFIVTIFLQIFFFDNLSLSLYLNPLIYISIIVLLPVRFAPILILLIGLLTGVIMDYAMGIAGINTISTVLIAFLRPSILGLFLDKNNLREGGVPSVDRLGRMSFLYYLLIIILIHHLLFFALEDMSIIAIPYTFIRFIVSSSMSLWLIWLIAQIFTRHKFKTSL